MRISAPDDAECERYECMIGGTLVTIYLGKVDFDSAIKYDLLKLDFLKRAHSFLFAPFLLSFCQHQFSRSNILEHHTSHIQTPKDTMNAFESVSEHESPETHENSEVFPDEDLTKFACHTIYEEKKSAHGQINWHGIARAHKSPDHERFFAFIDANEVLLKCKHCESGYMSSFKAFQEFLRALRINFPDYDSPTIDRMIDLMIMELLRKSNGAPNPFLVLYSLLAQISHCNLSMVDAWMQYQDKCSSMITNFNNFKIMIEQARDLREQDTLERKYLLTRMLCNAPMKELLEDIDDGGNFQLGDVFATVLPGIYFNALSWNQAHNRFNTLFGSELGLKNFKKYILPVMHRRMENILSRYSGLLRDKLRDEGHKNPVPSETFCSEFNKNSGYNMDAVILKDVHFTVLRCTKYILRCEKLLGKCDAENQRLYEQSASCL